MTDIRYPLSYSDNGGITVTATEDDERRSRIRHLLNTLAGERYVYPSFGLPIDMLFDATVPELVQERIHMILAQQNVADAKTTVSIIQVLDNKITVKVEYETGSVTVTL